MDFARLRSVPLVVAVGLLAPLVLLPAIALALVWWFAPDPFIAGGLLLVAACPIGGISNTYSYLARASTALSVTLTGLSSILAIGAIPVLSGAFERVLQEPLRVDAPVNILGLQLVLILALPIGLGMAIRRRWPDWARAWRPWFQRLAWILLALLLTLVLTVEARRVASVLVDVVLLATVFVTASFGGRVGGWYGGPRQRRRSVHAGGGVRDQEHRHRHRDCRDDARADGVRGVRQRLLPDGASADARRGGCAPVAAALEYGGRQKDGMR